MAGEAFPAILMRIRYEPDPSVKQALASDIDSALDGATAKFDRFSSEANRLIDQALGKGRNSSGALDLDVPGLQAAAKAQEARAIAAREVARATALAAQEDREGGASARAAAAATEALAQEHEQAALAARGHASAAEAVQARLNRQASATQEVVAAAGRGAVANDNVAAAAGRMRAASVGAGQQLQDLAISLYSGQQASVVFAQQLPQLAFALQGLEGSTNKTADRVGKFATFLSGPYGLFVGLAAGATVSLAADMIGLGEETEKAERKSFDFSRGLDVMALSAGEAKDAMEQLRQKIEATMQLQGDFLRQNAGIAQRSADDVEGRLQTNQARLRSLKDNLSPIPSFRGSDLKKIVEIERQIADDLLLLKGARSAAASAAVALGERNVAERRDPRQAAINRIDEQIGALKARRFRSEEEKDPLAGYFISQRQYETELDRLVGLRDAAEKAKREAERISRPRSSDNRQFGREINSAEGRSIAERAGFQVNSADRSNARQRELYSAWIAAGRPSDKPVAVQGTSAHERGNALDIQIRPGVTAASIKKAFADEGVRLTKILRERNIFHVEWSTSGADRATREADAISKKLQELKDFGLKAADGIATISSRFDEQPRLVDAAVAATKDLNDLIAELSERKPPNFEGLIADAEKAKTVIDDALVRPFRELAENSQREVDVQRLLLAGREKEAAVLQEVWRFQEMFPDLTAEQRNQVEGITRARQAELEVLGRLQEQQSSYLSATQSVRQELENLFAGEKVDFGRIFKRLQAQITVEAVFGDALRQLDKNVQARFDITGLQTSADTLEGDLYDLGSAVRDAARGIRGTKALPLGSAAGRADAEDIWWSLMGEIGSRDGNGAANDNQEIVVTGTRDAEAVARGIARSNSALGLTPDAYANMLFNGLAAPLLRGLPPAIAGPLSRVLGGAAAGYATGGVPGAVFGGLKGAVDSLAKDDGTLSKEMSKLSAGLGKLGAGASTGTMVSGISNALGLKMSNTGAQIGGAIGSFIPIPGGQIIGSIAGGLLGNLFAKRPRGAASVTNSGVSGSTNDSELTKAITGMGSDIQGAVRRIADALGAELGAFDIGLGRYKEYYQVSSKAGDPRLGNAYFGRDSRNALYDGTDEAAAAAAAIAEAIRDGAIKGLSATAERILKSTPDIDAAIEKILDFKSVFDRLRAYKDPVGAAIDDLDKEFGRLRSIFQSAGASAAEYAQLEELYGIERAKAVKEASERISGSMRSLLEELNIGDSGLSLRDRQRNAEVDYDALSARVRGGDVTAYDDFAQRARDLLDIERQLYGSTQQYFQRFNEVRGLSQDVLDQQRAMADQAVARDNGFDSGVIRDAVDGQTNILGGKLDAVAGLLGAVNDNLITFARQSNGAGAGSLADRFGLEVALR